MLLTGQATLEASMLAVNEGGIYRFLTKPWDDAMLLLSLSAATEKYNMEDKSRRLQNTLLQSEERYRTVVEQSPQSVIVHREGTIIYANPVAIRMFGATSLEELTGKPLLDRVHPDERQAVLKRLQMTPRWSVISPMVERRYLKLDGTVFTGEIQGTLIMYDGLPAFHLAIHDITERKKMEATLRDVSERLLLAVSAAEVGIWDWDVVNNRLTCDTAIYSLYGITPDKFNSAYEAWEAGLHPEDLEEARESIKRALRGEGEFNPEFRVVWPDGTVSWIKANALIQRDSEGRALRMTGTNWDITVNKLAVQAADAANQAKSAFLANMSHEIRTPMSGVLGMTGLLLDTPLTNQQRNYAEKIRISGLSLLAVINDILDISKIEAGKITLESIPFSVEAVIGNVVNLFEPLAVEKKIELHTTIDPELPAALLGDPQRLIQRYRLAEALAILNKSNVAIITP